MSSLSEYEKWLASGALTPEEKAELLSIKDDADEIESRFYDEMSFGTAGLRGVMKLGTACMNVHTIRHATQAFANVILREGLASPEVAVCHDCRVNSRDFAEAAASVLAANGIKVRIFESMRPTPELSFAVREYGCAAGINVTASHNPKEYNGYKVYWSDGAQLPPEHAAFIAAEMKKLDIFNDIKSVPLDSAGDLITVIGRETDERFLENVMAQSFGLPEKARDFKLVYTPFHGTGRELIPEALKRLGLKNVYCVEEQMVPDGTFPTVKSPNPENPEGFYMAVDLANKVGADFIIGSDPDADRVGVMVRGRDGEFTPVSGNKTGVLLLDYILNSMTETGRLPKKPVALKTIVTTNLAKAVAESYGVKCFETFTGFKFMAEKKNELEEKDEGRVLFSYEESYGYMIGDYVRDKDAVTACMVLCEMAAKYALEGKTLFDRLDEIAAKFGCYEEKTINLVMPGLDGMRDMKALMANLREKQPEEIGGIKVKEARDYLAGTAKTAAGERKLSLSGSDVLGYTLADGTNVYVRPSGTEPKIKVYALCLGENKAAALETVKKCDAWAQGLAK
ncbi:MAG: phospho-sugar mutase [Oscillospiraceae bacterium]|nr:phospho-sugar mutase [Oscillospiraceae bacterium]